MKIQIADALLNKFKDIDQAKVVLDFDHSITKETVGQDCCGITRYRLVITDQLPDVIDSKIDSNIGDIYVKDWGKIYLDENMVIRPTENNLIEFVSDGQTIAKNMEIVDYR